jgi:glycosyltransferase involved in cell wall biosynthesis
MKNSNSKNILIVTQYFWPENFLINNFALHLKKYANVTVLTGLPNYPDGKIFNKYKKIKKIFIENWEGIKVVRIPIIPRKKGGAINLSLNYLSFMINGIFLTNKINFEKRLDHILFYSTSPITSCLPAIRLKKIYNCKLSIWVQDLWPESLEATGYVKNEVLLKLFSFIVKYIYKRCDYIFAQSKSFIKNIKKYTSKKVTVLYNSHIVNTELNFKKIKIDTKIIKLLTQRKCFAFTGNIGLAQSVETIINCARIIEKKNNKIHFFIIGAGSQKNKIKKQIKKYKLSNVTLHGPFKPNVIDCILKKTVSNIITLKKHNIFSLTIPNKLQTYLLSGKPIICAADGELNNIIKKNSIGFAVKSEDYKNLSKVILKVSNFNKMQITAFKNRNLNFYNNNFEINKKVKLFLKTVKIL